MLFFKSPFAKSKLSDEHFPQFTKLMSKNEDIYRSFEECESFLVEEYSKGFSDFEKYSITQKLGFQSHLIGVLKAPKGV